MPESSLGPQDSINRLIRENRIGDFSSPNLAFGMRPTHFGPGTSRWVWESQPPSVLNPFGPSRAVILALFIDEMFSTAIASVLDSGEWAVTAEVKISFFARCVRKG